MSTFLLVITVLLSNGDKTVSVERFETHAQCYKAMLVISDVVPNLSAVCLEVGN